MEKYGAVSGSVKSFKRILKCHPWNPGGVDLP
ncbi:MAG: membrane protein insertion efficiency factor YidD [Candidatus Paceibacterota bacterium]